MAKHVIEYLQASAQNYPEKTAFADWKNHFTFQETWRIARSIGSCICEYAVCRQPVAVFMDKSVEMVAACLGVVCGGCFYCPLDSKMPLERIQTILSVLEPALIITDYAHKEEVKHFQTQAPVLFYEETSRYPDAKEKLEEVLSSITEQDPLYVLFTSGSTGIPKGVLVGERVVTNYLEWMEETFDFTSEDVLGNQAPLYFDVSVHDIYAALYFGARMEIIPPSYFSFPVKLVEYLNERHVTAFLWVPSAMSILANLDVFSFAVPKYLRHIFFAGEVLPKKHFDYWASYLPHAVYANLYGPTETFVCTAYVLDAKEKKTAGGEALPVGTPIRNVQALILKEDNRLAKPGEAGELCLRGSCLAIGYYRDLERTAASFVQNPLHSFYPERIYRTGDILRCNEQGELIYLSRKDFQIKHMGYRIELGEIEAAALEIREISNCACIYDEQKKQIVCCYEGEELEKTRLKQQLEKKLPSYMIPRHFQYFSSLPHNANGKIDRAKLKELSKKNEMKEMR